MAPRGNGVQIQISADNSNVNQVLDAVRQQLRKTREEADAAGASAERVGAGFGHAIPPMAAASASLRALEGNFTNNIRAGERFLSMLPGFQALAGAAFPVVGAIVLGDALIRMGEKAYDAYQNIVNLKGELTALNNLDLDVAKKLKQDDSAIERSTEQIIEATQGHKAALEYKLGRQNARPVDLSELFQSKDVQGLKTNMKADYETLYSAVAPQDLPNRISRIRTELTSMRKALGEMNQGILPADYERTWSGYGPGMVEDPRKYLQGRIKLASDIERELSRGALVNQYEQSATQAEINKPEKSGRGSAVRSDNTFFEAQRRLEESNAQLDLAQTRALAQTKLAQNEQLHRDLLRSDQDYLAEKLKQQTVEFDAEEKSLKARLGTLGDDYLREKGDKTLKRNPQGVSAEELNTLREMNTLQGQLDELQAMRAKAKAEKKSETGAASQAAELAGLRAAADLERLRNDGITAQIALIRRERELEAQKLVNQGGSQADAARVRALGEYEAKQLEVAEVERQIRDAETTYRLQEQAVSDQANKGLLSRRQAEQQLNSLQKQEAQALQALVQQYAALAAVLGGEYKEKLAELEAELTKLNTPSQKQEAQFGKTIAEGVTSMADTIAEQSLRGRTSFHEMAKEMEEDAVKLALKLAEQRFLNPGGGAGVPGAGGFGGALTSLFQGLFGGAGPGAAGLAAAQGAAASGGTIATIGSDLSAMIPAFAAGTDNAPGGTALVGEEGPELVNLPKGAGVTPNNVVSRLVENGGGIGKAPNVTTTVVNQSSQPVNAQPSQVSYVAQLKQIMIHTVLEDFSQGGPISQSMGGYRQS